MYDELIHIDHPDMKAAGHKAAEESGIGSLLPLATESGATPPPTSRGGIVDSNIQPVEQGKVLPPTTIQQVGSGVVKGVLRSVGLDGLVK